MSNSKPKKGDSSVADIKKNLTGLEKQYEAEVGKLRNAAREEIISHAGGKGELNKVDLMCDRLKADVGVFNRDFKPREHTKAQSEHTLQKFEANTAKHLSSAEKQPGAIKRCCKAIADCVKKIASTARAWISKVFKPITGLFKSKSADRDTSDAYAYKPLVNSPSSRRGGSSF